MSHTGKVIALGFALLAMCVICARLIGGRAQPSYVARAGLLFIGLWLIGAGINMWIGVSSAGYSVAEEAPIFLLVFSIPAAVALLIWWTYSSG
jgi:hypothetical protein